MLEIRLHPTPVISTLARCSVRRIAVRASPTESVGESGFPRTSASHLEATVGPERKLDLRPRVATRTSQPGGGGQAAGRPAQIRSEPVLLRSSAGAAAEEFHPLARQIAGHCGGAYASHEADDCCRRRILASTVAQPHREASSATRDARRLPCITGARDGSSTGKWAQHAAPPENSRGCRKARSPGAVTDTVARSCDDIAPMTSGLTIALRTGTAATSCSPCCGMAPSSTPPKAV